MDDIPRAERARAICTDDLVVEALDTIEKLYLDKFKNSEPEDTQARETAYAMLRALQEFRGHFESVITTGKLKREQLKKLRI